MLPGVFHAQKKDGSAYFRASLTYQGKHISLGSYATEREAHLAYRQARHILLLDVENPVNHADAIATEPLAEHAKNLASHTDTTATEPLAEHAENPANHTETPPAQPVLTTDNVDALPGPLPFEKRISLLNFRDNGIYFKNPIYLKQNYFLYLIAPHDELKFDADDLFYYSSHKIMRRKGHLFVNDYGMQVNILSRYGIRNFAVAGRDYRFVNGDPTDFRYSNIEVINRYYGVSRSLRGSQLCYRASIHIVGTHVIGDYPTEAEAAIAYNKAVDLAKAHGFDKNYMTNYLPDLSPREYAKIYSDLAISQRFLDYLSDGASDGARPMPCC